MNFIITIIVVIIIVVILFSRETKSKTLGDEVKLPGSMISGNLLILTPRIVPFQNGAATNFLLYEKGLMIFQGQDGIEVPWSAMTEIDAINHSHLSAQSGSVLGGAAVGGLLMGEVGALIGGLGGLQSTTIKGHLFYVSFNYGEFGVTTFAIYVGAEVFEFMKLINQYKAQAI